MRRSLTLVLAGLALASAAACDDGTTTAPAVDPAPSPTVGGGIWAGNVTVTPAPRALVLGNNTTRPVGYFLIESELATRALWRPCVERTGCPTIAPGERRTVAAADIPGADARKRDVLVYWWHLVEQRDGTLAPDSVRFVAARVGE